MLSSLYVISRDILLCFFLYIGSFVRVGFRAREFDDVGGVGGVGDDGSGCLE